MNVNDAKINEIFQGKQFIDDVADMNDYIYFDICDIHLLPVLYEAYKQQIIIGVDERFINAVNECTEWELYHLVYARDNCYEVERELNARGVTMSAIGLLKRIVSHKHFHYVSFVFKQGNIHANGLGILNHLCNSNITIQLSTYREKDLPNTLLELRQTFQQFFSEKKKTDSVLIHLKDSPIIDRHFVTERLLDVLEDIQIEEDVKILIQKEISHSIYSISDIDNYEPCERLLDEDKSIMDYLTEAWQDNALLLSI